MSCMCIKMHLLRRQLVQNFSNMFYTVWISHWDIYGFRSRLNDGKYAQFSTATGAEYHK